jgi:hypothetical protein
MFCSSKNEKKTAQTGNFARKLPRLFMNYRINKLGENLVHFDDLAVWWLKNRTPKHHPLRRTPNSTLEFDSLN